MFLLFPPSDPDAPPRELNVTPSSNGLRIAWGAPAVLSGPTWYLVQVNTDVCTTGQHGFMLVRVFKTAVAAQRQVN